MMKASRQFRHLKLTFYSERLTDSFNFFLYFNDCLLVYFDKLFLFSCVCSDDNLQRPTSNFYVPNSINSQLIYT